METHFPANKVLFAATSGTHHIRKAVAGGIPRDPFKKTTPAVPVHQRDETDGVAACRRGLFPGTGYYMPGRFMVPIA
jgi:hypothetical protein